MRIEGDRLIAFLIIDGKVYQSDSDHQECLEEYYKDNGIASEFDWESDNIDEVKEIAIKKTISMRESHTAYGFDLFELVDGRYVLLAYDEETFNKNKDFMESYVRENKSQSIELGYFNNSSSWWDATLTA